MSVISNRNSIESPGQSVPRTPLLNSGASGLISIRDQQFTPSNNRTPTLHLGLASNSPLVTGSLNDQKVPITPVTHRKLSINSPEFSCPNITPMRTPKTKKKAGCEESPCVVPNFCQQKDVEKSRTPREVRSSSDNREEESCPDMLSILCSDDSEDFWD